MAVWTAPVNKQDGDQVTEAEWDAYFGTLGNLQYLKDAIDAIGTAPVGFSAGAVGAPSIYMGGDTTTGFYRPAANQIGITVSGALVSVWSSTGLSIATQNALTFTHATAEIIPGATSLTFRNNADNASNITITDAGAITLRSTLGGVTTVSITGDPAIDMSNIAPRIRATHAQASLTIIGLRTAANAGGTIFIQTNNAADAVTTRLAITGGVAIAALNLSAMKFYPMEDDGLAQSACAIYAGTGAPNNANGADGDIYFRSDGAALTTTYQRRAGVWTGLL